MTRNGLILGFVLTLLTGFLVGQLRLVTESSGITTPAQRTSARDSLVANHFYETLNEVIRSGSVTNLGALLAPGYIEHASSRPGTGTSKSLEQYFLSLHERALNAELQVANLTAGGSLVAVQIELKGADLTAARLPIEYSGVAGLELLRIENDKVVERWANRALPPQIEFVGSLLLAPYAALQREPRLESVSFSPGSELTIEQHEGTLLRVGSGELNITSPGASADAISPVPTFRNSNAWSGREELLQTGDTVRIPAGMTFVLRNSANQTAHIVWLSIYRVDTSYYSTRSNQASLPTPGIQRKLIAAGVPILPATRPISLVVDRVVGATDISLPMHTTGDVELLMVESGVVDVVVNNKFVLAVDDSGTIRTQTAAFQLTAGQGLAASQAIDLEYHVPGTETATFWVVSVSPP